MKRLARIAVVALPLLTLAAAPAYADVKTHSKTTVKFEGMLGRMFNFFGGKAAKEGIESRTAVKGNRKATMNDNAGHIVDLAEEKVYDLDLKKKTYTVTTFDELRRKMREAEDRARKQAEKEEPAKKEEAQKPTKEFEIDFDVKATGEKKSIAGYDTHETIVTITVREKGKTLEEGGGLVMTNDTWLGPRIPELKELADFDLKYWRQLQGPEAAEISAEQMASVMAMYPLVGKAMDRMAKDGDKLAGTPLDTTSTFESVMSKDQMAQAQSSDSGSKGGGIGGMLARKIIKKDEPKARATIMTTHHDVLEVSKSVEASDLAIPPDFKEKK
ncbi:MAG TPA: hypothetical protein VF921_09075 [Vicinamibacterales bacterium]